MLVHGLYNSVLSWLKTPEKSEPPPVLEDEDLNDIIAAITEEQPRRELELLESSPIVSENEGYKCQDRMGYVTRVSTNTGFIDDQFLFHLEDVPNTEIKVGVKVSYLAYRLGANEEWRVKNIFTVHEENWDAEDVTAPDVSVNGADLGDSEILAESAALEKTLLGQVERREGRVVVISNNIRCDLNTTSAEFTPFAGDWVALDAFVQVCEDSVDLSGEILEIVHIRPVRRCKKECVVTRWDPKSRCGSVDNNIFFQKELCSPGYIPSRGDKVVVEAIESSYGGLQWRALHVEPHRQFGRPCMNADETEYDEFDDPELFKDKMGVYISKKLDFGTVELDSRRVLEMVIENGGTSPVRIENIRILKSQSRQITLPHMPALPRTLKIGALMRINISCLGRNPGFHTEVIVVEMQGFKIARKIFCEVKSTIMEAALLQRAPQSNMRYNYTSNRLEAVKSQKRWHEKESSAIPGVPLCKTPAFMAFRMPQYMVPRKIWEIFDCPRYEINTKILEAKPMFQCELSGQDYIERFQFLLHLAEADAILDLRRYDMNRVKFYPRGEYLVLTVPGLAESRPSLLIGDRVEAYSVNIGGSGFEGVIHKVLHSEVCLKFDRAFHSTYSGEDYAVKFVQSRGYWKKCHHGVSKVVQLLGTQWLFPAGVAGKPLQINFEEVDDEPVAPAVQPTSSPQPPFAAEPAKPAPSSSDREKCPEEITPSVAETKVAESLTSVNQTNPRDLWNSSSSSDEGVALGSPRPCKKNSDRPLSKLLSMIKEKPSKGVSSDSESRHTSSDVDRKSVGDESKQPVRRSPRQSLVKALEMLSSGNSLVQNSSASNKNSPSDRSSSSDLESNPTRSQNGSPSIHSNDSAADSAAISAAVSAARISAAVPENRADDLQVSASPSVDVNGSATAAQNSTGVTENRADDREGSSAGLRRLRWINKSLNCRQRDAVRNVLRGEARPLPYVIFGPPGTGKTMTLVETILQIYLLMPNSRILIATPSNSSADLIAERLLDSKILKPGDMVRLVAFSRLEGEKLPQRLLPYCATVDANLDAPSNPEMIHNVPSLSAKAIGRHRITVTTCLTAGQLMFLALPKDHFSHVIMDEAGQATEPETMVALAFLNRNKGQAVLAGDPLQLGPVVPSTVAAELGLGLSFLARILKRFPYNRDSEGFPETAGYDPRLVTRLIYNYRSVPSILQICSEMFYDSELVSTIDGKNSAEAKILDVLASNSAKYIPRFGVVFEGVRGENLQEDDCPSWFNLHEAASVCEYVGALLKHINPEDIGIITPYRKQVQKLRQSLDQLRLPIPKIATVEEFQGQERLVIIVSTVRSSRQILKADQKHHLGFVSSPQRLNVAISRAKSLLIVVGNPHLLSYDTYWKNLLRYCCENGSYFGCDLPLCMRQIL